MRTNSARYAKRGLTICGFGNFDFDQMSSDLAFVHEQFIRSGLGHVEAQSQNEFRDMYTVCASNNYFTPGHMVPYKTYEPYPAAEDPFGALHRCVTTTSQRAPVVRLRENKSSTTRKSIAEARKYFKR